MKRKLFTIGYTGYSIENFVAELESNKIECLVDIREIPLSRKPGFSKSLMNTRLEQSGIKYRHLRWLGSPKELRHELRRTNDFDTFFSGLHAHLQKENAVAQFLEAGTLCTTQRCCLMCCCPDWQFCHRKLVVEFINGQKAFSLVHLAAKKVQSVKPGKLAA